MALIARWIDETRPVAIVVDVSVEVALFVRLLGVPVIVMAMPGERIDGPHALVHQIADHIIAASATGTLRTGMAARIRRQDQLRRGHQPFRGPRRSGNRRRTAPPSSFSAGRADATSTKRRSMQLRQWYPRSLGRHWVCGAVPERLTHGPTSAPPMS